MQAFFLERGKSCRISGKPVETTPECVDCLSCFNLSVSFLLRHIKASHVITQKGIILTGLPCASVSDENPGRQREQCWIMLDMLAGTTPRRRSDRPAKTVGFSAMSRTRLCKRIRLVTAGLPGAAAGSGSWMWASKIDASALVAESCGSMWLMWLWHTRSPSGPLGCVSGGEA